jgi:hypothetical protein
LTIRIIPAGLTIRMEVDKWKVSHFLALIS